MTAVTRVALFILATVAFTDGLRLLEVEEIDEAEVPDGSSTSQPRQLKYNTPSEDPSKYPNDNHEDADVNTALGRKPSNKSISLQPTSLEDLFSTMDDQADESSASREKKKKDEEDTRRKIGTETENLKTNPYLEREDYLSANQEVEEEIQRQQDVEQRKKERELLLALLQERKRYKEFTDQFGHMIGSLMTPLSTPWTPSSPESSNEIEGTDLTTLSSPLVPTTAAAAPTLEEVSTTLSIGRKVNPFFRSLLPEIIAESSEMMDQPIEENGRRVIVEPSEKKKQLMEEYGPRRIVEPHGNTNQLLVDPNVETTIPNSRGLLSDQTLKENDQTPRQEQLVQANDSPLQTSVLSTQDVETFDDGPVVPRSDDINLPKVDSTPIPPTDAVEVEYASLQQRDIILNELRGLRQMFESDSFRDQGATPVQKISHPQPGHYKDHEFDPALKTVEVNPENYGGFETISVPETAGAYIDASDDHSPGVKTADAYTDAFDDHSPGVKTADAYTDAFDDHSPGVKGVFGMGHTDQPLISRQSQVDTAASGQRNEILQELRTLRMLFFQ